MLRILFLALALFSSPAYADIKGYDATVKTGLIERFDQYAHPAPAELVSTVQAPTYNISNPRNFVRVLEVMVPDCQPGDIIQADSAFGVTSEHSLAEVSSGMILTPEASGTDGIVDLVGNQTQLSAGEGPTNGVWITRFPGRNVPLNVHHDFHPHSGSITVPEGMSGDLYVAVIMYADAGGYFAPSPRYVSIDTYTSHISATITRKRQ